MSSLWNVFFLYTRRKLVLFLDHVKYCVQVSRVGLCVSHEAKLKGHQHMEISTLLRLSVIRLAMAFTVLHSYFVFASIIHGKLILGKRAMPTSLTSSYPVPVHAAFIAPHEAGLPYGPYCTIASSSQVPRLFSNSNSSIPYECFVYPCNTHSDNTLLLPKYFVQTPSTQLPVILSQYYYITNQSFTLKKEP